MDDTKPATGNSGGPWQVWCCTCHGLVAEGRGVRPNLRDDSPYISQPEVEQHLQQHGVHWLQLTIPEVRTLDRGLMTE